MMKIKRITLSGLRGILPKQDLLLTNNGSPSSLVVYGLNSSGKTSFVDGLEWFLSPSNEIEWLKREDAGCHAYPHQEAKDGETYVEIEFSDSNFGILKKEYNFRKITMPILTPDDKFEQLYKSFTIRPYLRYLEIIDFVFNRTGVEKYQKLANWMGFEDELAFQEMIALKIIPQLRNEEQKIQNQNNWVESETKRLTGNSDISDIFLLAFCNNLLKQIGHAEVKSTITLPTLVKELDKKRTNANSSKITIITKAQVNLQTVKFNSDIIALLQVLSKQIDNFSKKKELADKIESVNLYEKASEILEKEEGVDVLCPVCGLSWKKTELIKHIKNELVLLQEVKESHNKILEVVGSLKFIVSNESESIRIMLGQLQTIKDISIDIDYQNITLYERILGEVYKSLDRSIFEVDIKIDDFVDRQKKATAELDSIKIRLEKEKRLLQPSQTDILLNETVEKLRALNDKLEQTSRITHKQKFYETEISKFVAISDELFRLVQENITKRFKDISLLIEKYFKILRQDKDIKGIEIILNLEKIRAAGRSAEIQLSYYDLVVKPAYKVLSESLLNSLGLAVYFTCVKKFNSQSMFIMLDDIMNSLDVGHRDTLLDLIEQEFSDYQIILFTHDLHWFERIQRRFPHWLNKKIKNWSYTSGPNIDQAKTSLEDINELLQDSTKAHEAGRDFGVYVEKLLNELCELLQAEVRYRYSKNDPPTIEELFIALHKRFKDKIDQHPVVELLQNAQKYEPIIRNATSHARQNYTSSISPHEVKRAMEEWEKVEKALWCSKCNKFVEYKRDRNQIECRCGSLRLNKPTNNSSITKTYV